MTTRPTELAYWINEREEMRRRKELGLSKLKYGWSNDPDMGLVRYCNVHREDDKVTRWMAEHWRPQYHAVWEIVLARMLNYIPTLESIVDYADPPWDLAGLADGLKVRRECGEKVFTSAYTISTCGRSMDKIDYVMEVVEEAQRFEVFPTNTLAAWHAWLMGIKGLGSFLAAQVVADLKNTVGHPLGTAPDYATWCAPGPGSLKGLSAYYGGRITPSTFYPAIEDAWQEVKPMLSALVNPEKMHMQDFQNCLCEFSKYVRVKEGGHVRNRYAG